MSSDLPPAEGSPGAPAGAVVDAEAGAKDPEDLLDDQADAAEDFLNGLLDVLDMDGEAQADIEDETILVDIDGPDMGVLIGRHGMTLEALQELTRAAVQHQTAARARLILDIGGYRDRHREMLERRARQVASRVRKERAPQTLEPMNSYDRKIIHSVLADFDGVITTSEGEDPARCVVVRPA